MPRPETVEFAKAFLAKKHPKLKDACGLAAYMEDAIKDWVECEYDALSTKNEIGK